MKKLGLILAIGLLVSGLPVAAAEEAAPRVALDTSHGTVVLELYPDKAPKTVANFLSYVDDGFYDGTIFHRVVAGFMIQGGGFTPDLEKKSTKPAVENEADNGLSNERGSIAMARTMDPHSATAQFFINVAENFRLDHTAPTVRGWGYAVFGRVVEGMEVVDAIARVQTGSRGPMGNVPVETVMIDTVRRVETAESEAAESTEDEG